MLPKRRHFGFKRSTSAVVALLLCSGCGSGSAGAGSSAGGAPPSYPSPAGTIVFTVQHRESDMAIGRVTTMRPDGSDRNFLYGRSCCARLSAQGTTLMDNVQVSRRAYRVARYDLSDHRLTKLSIPAPPPDNGSWSAASELGVGSWSPDGLRMACETSRGIFTYRTSDGGDPVQITHRHGIDAGYSPDGTKLLFFVDAPGTQGQDEPDQNLYVVNTDGTGLVRLNPRGTTTAGFDMPVLASPSWSPDSRMVAFVAAPGSISENGDSRAVYVVNADGSRAHPITSYTSTFSARWSPDGRWIAYDHPNEGSRDLFVIHPDGSGEHAVTSARDGRYSFGPAWSPDSRWLLFIRGTGEDFDTTDLWIGRVDGSGMRPVTHSPARYRSYAWSALT
jgi:hypothetical protein